MKSGMIDYIFIEGLRVEARVGIYPREQLAQTLEIDLTFGVPPGAVRRAGGAAASAPAGLAANALTG